MSPMTPEPWTMCGERKAVLDGADQKLDAYRCMGIVTEEQQIAMLTLIQGVQGNHISATVSIAVGENFGSLKIELTGYDAEVS